MLFKSCSSLGTEEIGFGDDPERTEYQYDVPENMYFIDNHGMVLLIGCRASGFKENLILALRSLGGILQKISVGAAVFSYHANDMNSFNGYRTEIENLSQWFQMNTIKNATCMRRSGWRVSCEDG